MSTQDIQTSSNKLLIHNNPAQNPTGPHVWNHSEIILNTSLLPLLGRKVVKSLPEAVPVPQPFLVGEEMFRFSSLNASRVSGSWSMVDVRVFGDSNDAGERWTLHARAALFIISNAFLYLLLCFFLTVSPGNSHETDFSAHLLRWGHWDGDRQVFLSFSKGTQTIYSRKAIPYYNEHERAQGEKN